MTPTYPGTYPKNMECSYKFMGKYNLIPIFVTPLTATTQVKFAKGKMSISDFKIANNNRSQALGVWALVAWVEESTLSF